MLVFQFDIYDGGIFQVAAGLAYQSAMVEIVVRHQGVRVPADNNIGEAGETLCQQGVDGLTLVR